MSRTDAHGNPVTGPATAVDRYDQAVDHLLRLRPEVVEVATELATEHPTFPMGMALVGYLHLMSTDQSDVATGAQAAAAVASHAGTEREAFHADALAAWAVGNWQGAARILDDLLLRWPTDLLALSLGHQLDFFTGDAANLRDRPARSRSAVDPTHPHHGMVTGMLAFGLEESGTYAMAEAAAHEALDRNPDDVWALHAGAHTYEMQGRVDEGIRFMQGRVSDWGSGNLFTVHNWWHLALYHLEAGAPEGALAIYDAEVHHEGSDPVSLELLDASALLWRLRLDDVAVGDRFEVLARAWDAWDTGVPWYAFDDLHAVIARCGAGRIDDARAVIERLDAYVAGGGTGSNVAMTAEVGLPACRAVVAFTDERYDDAIAELAPVRRIAHRFGGSHAQRDLLARTLTEAALRAGRHDLARALLAERLTLRDSSVYGMSRLARLLRATGADGEAAATAARAEATQARFAAALVVPAPVS